MRILFLDQFSGLGGAQLCLLDLLRHIHGAGVEAHVAVPGDGPVVERLKSAGLPVYPFPLQRYSLGGKTVSDAVRFVRGLPRLGAEIRRLVDLVKPDILYVNGPRNMPPVAWARVSLPVVFHAHNWISTLAGKPLATWAVRATKARVIAASRFVARQWPGADVVYGGVDYQWPAQPPTRDGRLRIGMIGRISPQKGQLNFVKAAARLSHDLPDARYVVCGEALFDDHRAESYRRDVVALAPANVEFAGWTDHVFDVLSSLDLLVAPSANEGGIPRVILESFAAHTPVLALNSGAIPEVLVEARNAFLLRDGTAAEIAQRLRELAPRKQALAAAAAEAHRRWREEFQVEHFGRRVEQFLRRL